MDYFIAGLAKDIDKFQNNKRLHNTYSNFSGHWVL